MVKQEMFSQSLCIAQFYQRMGISIAADLTVVMVLSSRDFKRKYENYFFSKINCLCNTSQVHNKLFLLCG